MKPDSLAVELMYMDVDSALLFDVPLVLTMLRSYHDVVNLPHTVVRTRTNFQRQPDGSETFDERVFSESESKAWWDEQEKAALEPLLDAVVRLDATTRKLRPRVWDVVDLARAERDIDSPPCRSGPICETSYLEVADALIHTIRGNLAMVPHDHANEQPVGFREALRAEWESNGTLRYATLEGAFDDLSAAASKRALADLRVYLEREKLAIRRNIEGEERKNVPASNPEAPALTADHESILSVLAKTPQKCMTVIDVLSAGTIRNRETVGRLLGELASFGLVYRPHGIRKGYALTESGKARTAGTTATT